MQRTWVLTADSSRAKLFEAVGRKGAFHEIESFSNPEGRANNRELISDAYGRYAAQGKPEHGYTSAPIVDAVEHETELFSISLANYLDKARALHRYDKLCLVAAPKFLVPRPGSS